MPVQEFILIACPLVRLSRKTPFQALSSWLSTVRGGLGRLPVHGLGFKFKGWPGNLGQDGIRVCFEINFSDRKEGSTLSSIVCVRWWVKH